MDPLAEERERAHKLYLDSDTKFSSDFKLQARWVFGPIVALISCIHKPLSGGGKTLDPELVKILDWGKKLFEDGDAISTSHGIHACNDQAFDELLRNAPRLIHFLPKYITSEVAGQITLDPVAEAHALRTGREFPIAEEVAYLIKKDRTTVKQMAIDIQDERQHLRDAQPLSKRVHSMTTSKRGSKEEGKLFWDVVCLVIRSLRRFIKNSKAGTTEGSDRFRIQPLGLEPMVTKWTETWIEWSER